MMSCSKQEIELKRLAALQKRQNKIGSASQATKSAANSNTSSVLSNNSNNIFAGPIKTSVTNTQKIFHPYAKRENSAKSENIVLDSKVISGTVYLISEERFEVNPSEFCAPLVNIFKTMNTRSYDGQSKLWNFSINEYDKLMSKVAPLAPYIVLGTLPPYVLKLLKEEVVDPKRVDLSPIEPTLRDQLMPFQEDGVRFGITKQGRCMVADDMGLGKTFQALALASYYQSDWPLLIVTTSSMRETWQSKVHSLLPRVPLTSVISVWSGKEVCTIADTSVQVVIMSYKLCALQTEVLFNKKFGFIIIDESHYLKSHKARCTVSLNAIARRARRVVLLSGTPALSRPKELYTQLHLIQPNFFSGYTEYGKRYCGGKQTQYGWDMLGQSNLTELQIILHKKFLIRRTKDQVLDLKEKTRESIFLDQSLLEFSKAEQKDLSNMADKYVKTKSSEKHAALLCFFSESSKVKIPAICKYLKQLLRSDNSEKFLVFAHHKNMIAAICDTLDEMATPYICIVGNTPPTVRAELVDRYQGDTSCRAAVLSTTACGAGLTLTAANLLIFAELHWNPGILTQAESRAHRIGQAGTVRVKYLLARGTVDDYMWPMLQDKLNVLNEVGLCKDTFENTTLSRQETKNEITQYLSQTNPNDYIPGTNIKKDEVSLREDYKRDTVDHKQEEDIDKSFLEDDEGDQLLANLNF